jgi:hypothetical protein
MFEIMQPAIRKTRTLMFIERGDRSARPRPPQSNQNFLVAPHVARRAV